MKNLKSFKELARQLEKSAALLPVSYALSMESSAIIVEEVAKKEIGTYQREDMGPFAAWVELKTATKLRHIDAITNGMAAPDAGMNTPELVSGKMRSDIGHESSESGFIVGGDEILSYQEMGTGNMPPRPILGPALYRSIHEMLKITGAAIERTLAGKK